MAHSKDPFFQAGYPDRQAAFDAFGRHVNRGKVTTYNASGLDAVMGARSGATFADAFMPDRVFYNCHSNGGVFNLGHRHPAVVSAVQEALGQVDMGNHHLVSPLRARLAERLAATTGGHLSGVVFGVGGGEAIDLAIKLARGVTQRQGVVSARGGYHGHTGLAMAAGDQRYRQVFGPNSPDFRQVPFDDISAMEAALGRDTAAVILEPIPATLGMPIPRPGYLREVQSLCRRFGAKFILDEVQTGLGRTGRIWAYEHEAAEPDILVTGKGLSGGVYPISATLMTEDIHAFFDDHPFIHISTFGGAEPGCAAALAVLDIIESEGFLDRVEAIGERFAHGLADLPIRLRRRGLMMALKLPLPLGGMVAMQAAYREGVFVVMANNDKSVLQFLPPLILSDEEVDAILWRLHRAFRGAA